MKERDKGGEIRQLSSVRYASSSQYPSDHWLLIYPLRSACPAPGPRPLEVGLHQYQGSLCSCSDSLLHCSG